MELVASCKPGQDIVNIHYHIPAPPLQQHPLAIIANRFNKFVLANNLKRVRFFPNGSYNYKPSQSYFNYIKRFAKHSIN